jgi:uncharacterized 2Fe-2S/4Fe-4S cluster protein (DUF4445 family)
MSRGLIIETEEGAAHAFDGEPEGSSRTLADALAGHGFPLNTRCGERGLCRGCEVQLRVGAVLSMAGERVAAPATVRACQVRTAEAVTVRIPARSRIDHQPWVSETFRIEIPCAHQPLFALGARDAAFAVDVGTTTVVVLIVDLATGQVLSRAGAFNEQIRFGDNVITRIDAVRTRAGALEGMQAAIVRDTISPLLLRACERANRAPSRIAGGTIAGNTTMLHLLAGEDPSSLGVAPFVPRFTEARQLIAREIGLSADAAGGALDPDTPIQLLPGISAYVGADIVAGIYATGMAYDAFPSLLVDIGTNGEVVLQNGGKLYACATAAGPAFEGSGLCCGSRARDGAVSGIRLSGDPFGIEVEVIGGIPPARAAGICGSAYVDFLSQGRSSGLLLESGRFDPEAWARVPAEHRFEEDRERALRIAGGQRISEVDVALLLQAKAAIGAGIETLLECAGLAPGQLQRVYLAGGFGMHLDVGHAIASGLLPGFTEETVRVVGNTALAGALLAIVDKTTLAEMEAMRLQVDVLELNLQEGFEDRYIDHLMLP